MNRNETGWVVLAAVVLVCASDAAQSDAYEVADYSRIAERMQDSRQGLESYRRELSRSHHDLWPQAIRREYQRQLTLVAKLQKACTSLESVATELAQADSPGRKTMRRFETAQDVVDRANTEFQQGCRRLDELLLAYAGDGLSTTRKVARLTLLFVESQQRAIIEDERKVEQWRAQNNKIVRQHSPQLLSADRLRRTTSALSAANAKRQETLAKMRIAARKVSRAMVHQSIVWNLKRLLESYSKADVEYRAAARALLGVDDQPKLSALSPHQRSIRDTFPLPKRPDWHANVSGWIYAIETSVTPRDLGVTAEVYHFMSEGMKYVDVWNAIGQDGVEISRYGRRRTYIWHDGDKKITASFENDLLTKKSAVGL